MPRGEPRATYRDEITTAYARIAALEARNRSLEDALASKGDAAPAERVRDMDATLRRWDRVRAFLATLLGLTGLFALFVAERWDVHVALLASCSAMVAVGITLAWPQIVRANADPKPYAKDVSRPWRRGAGQDTAFEPGVRVALEGRRSEPAALEPADLTAAGRVPAAARRE